MDKRLSKDEANTYPVKRNYGIKRKKILSKSSLVEKLDRIFSQFIRLRDSNSDGYCSCISCNSIHFWKTIHNGHYVNRKHMSTRYNEKNCNAQCIKCNTFDEGNVIGYTKGLIKKYGESVIDELDMLKHSISKINNYEFEILIDHYKKEVDRLLKEKGLNK